MSWQSALQTGFKTPDALLKYLNLEKLGGEEDAHRLFKTRIPLSFASRMKKGDINCPLLRQVLPHGLELFDEARFVLDPLEENKANPKPGLLHKYHGRVLVMLSVSCAVNCRYCFRRHFPYEENRLSQKDWDSIFEYLNSYPDVHEVILSGGDPLMLSNAHLGRFIKRLESIKTVKTLRFHTRLPVVIPERIDDGFLKLIDETPLNKVMVLHINHANELCQEMGHFVRDLKKREMMLLNQSVLLKGVNDSEKALIDLSHALFDKGILPYYLHLLDKVKGTHHFEVDERRALSLFDGMQCALPGYLVPKLVREIPGVPYKTLCR